MENKKEFGELSEFNGREVELYRSSDLHNTAIYFTEVDGMNQEQRKNASAYFELLRFGLKGGDHQIYVRFPYTDYFVEIIDSGGSGGGIGNMQKHQYKNIWLDKDESPLTIFDHEDNLIVFFGRMDWTPKFNFMTKVASYDKGNPFCHPYPNETFLNFSGIEFALRMKYLKIPEHIRTIHYCFKTMDSIPTFIVVDSPTYNFRYNNQRFRLVTRELEGYRIEELEIKSFQRFRDGGTTIITAVDTNNVEHKLCAPQRMFPTENEVLSDKWDDTDIVPASKEEEQMLVKLLDIELEPIETDDEN